MAIGFSTYLLSEEELKLGEEFGKAYWSGNHKFGVINNSAPDEIKNYQIKAKDGKCWKKVHLELMGSGSHTSSVPIRQISCKNERAHSETTGCYELTKTEADTLKSHPDIEWVQLDPEFHEEARIPVEVHSINRFGKNVKNYRNLSKENNTPSTPTEVANSLIAVSGSPNWIKVSDSHPNTPAMNYWGVICQDLKDYAVYPSAPANANDQDPLRESIQTVSNAVTCSSAGHYQLQVWADGEWAGCMVENVATGFKLENNDSKFRTLDLDERGRGHFHEIINLGYLSASTQLQITCKVRNGTSTDPNKRNWANNPGGIGWKLLHLGFVTTELQGGAFPSQPLTHAFPSGTSASIPSSEDNRTNYGPLRMSTAGTNPWSSDANAIVNSDVTYDNDGTDIDLIIVDTGTWTGHPEFCTNDKDPQNFIPGNVLSRSGKSGVLDLALDAPYYLDPEWFDADPSSRLITRWDGTIVPDETTARNWWYSSVLRSSTFNAVSTAAGTGAFSITIPSNYTRANNCGTDTTLPTVNDHGTKCGGVAYGKNFGKAFNCNKWAICAIDMSTKVPTESGWTMQKIFHKTKPNNPKFSGNSIKNPTVSSNSWGYGSAYVGFFVSGMERVKYNYQGTEASFPNRPTTDVYGNSYSQYPDGPGSGFDYNSYSNPWVTNLPAFIRTSSRNALISTGYYSFGYYWKMSPHLRAENTEEPREGFAAEYNAALEAVNSGIHFCNSAGNDQNYFVTKDDPNYDNWIARLDSDGTTEKGVAGDESSHHRVYPNRSSYPSQLAYDATGLNTILSVGAMDDRYNSNYPFSDHSADPKNDSGTVDSNFTGDKLESMAMGGPRGNPSTLDFGGTVNYEDYPFWKDRFSGWYFGRKMTDGGFYSCKGSAVDFFAPADGMLSACGSSNSIVSNDNRYVTRNDDIPASWSSSSQAYLDGWFDGTSSACPALAGTIACVLQQNRHTSPVHLKSYLKSNTPDATSFFNGYKPSSSNPNDPLWLLGNSNMGDPIKVIKEVTTHINTPNPCYTVDSGIDATRNLNERFTITSESGVTMMIRGIREFSASDVSVPVSLRVVGGADAGARYYPVYPTNDMTSAERGNIKFRIKSGSNDQILEVSNDGGSTYTYFSIRVVNGNFVISRQGLVYYYLNVADDVTLPEDTTPTYILTTNLLTVNEGSQLITTVQTTYVAENTTLYWSLSGTGITSGDFSSGSLTGQVSIAANGNAVFNHTLANDLSTEGTETINIKLFTDASRNTQVATANVNINDTSKGATYSIAPDELSINEGETVRYTLTTTNVANGTVLYTDLTGISANDLSSGQLQSSWSVFDNTFFSDYTLAEDSTTEGNEVITFKVYTDSARTNEVASNSSLTVVDTSVESSPSYSLSCTPTGSVNEGSNIVATVATTNVTTGTVLYWEISGTNITGADFTTSLTGSSSVNSSGNAVWTNTLANDVTTEGDETFNLKVYTDSGRTNQVASTWTQVIKDTSLGITYGIAAAKTSYNEGETMYAAVSTTNASVGSTLYWKIDPISNTLNASDFSGGLEGSGTLDSNGQFTFTRVISNDTTTEGNETFTLKLYTDSSRSNLVATSSTITIVDTSVDAPTYTISASPTSVNEGSSFTTTVTTTNVPENTTLYWALSGSNVDASDFSSGSLTGSGTITSNSFNFSHTLDEDVTTEGAETVNIKLYSDSGRTVQVGSTVDVTINDTSQTPVVPSYSITPSKTSINEGETLTTTVTTSNVSQGTTLYWTLDQHTGNVTVSDFSSGSWTGDDTISNNTITFSHTIAADATTEGEEKFAIKLYTDSGLSNNVANTPTITINDTSQPSGSPTYVLSANTNPIDEGSSLIITATTTNVAENTTLYWSFSGTGIAAADFMEGTLESNTVIPASGVNNWSTSIKSDALTEGNETLLVKLFTDSARTTQVGNTLNVTINDTSTTPTPTYALNTNVSQIDEGGAWTTEVVTGNVAQGTTLYWSLSGTNLDASDFSSGALTGDDVTAANGTFSFSHTTSLDVTTEGDETAVIKLFTDSARTNQVATTSVLIKDTSESSGSPTYTLSTTATRFNEGDSFTTTVTTTDVAEGTVLYWALSGTGVSEDDFNLADTTTGSGTITSNTFTFNHTIKEDAITEGDEVISIKLYINADRTIQVGNTLAVTIRDSSQPGYCIRVTAPNNNEYILTGADRNGTI